MANNNETISNIIIKLRILKNDVREKILIATIRETTIEERLKIIAENIKLLQELENKYEVLEKNVIEPFSENIDKISDEYYKKYGYHTVEKVDFKKMKEILKNKFNINIKKKNDAEIEFKKIFNNDPRVIKIHKDREPYLEEIRNLNSDRYNLKEDTQRLYRSTQ